MKRVMCCILFVLLYSTILFSQQEGKLKKAEKKTPQNTAVEKQDSEVLPKKKTNNNHDADFYLVDKDEIGNMMTTIMAKRQTKTTVTYSEECLNKFFPGYGYVERQKGIDRPYFVIDAASEMDAQPLIPELIKEFAKLKKYQIVCMKPQIDDPGSFVFVAIPRFLKEKDIVDNIVVSSRSFKRIGIPTLDVFNLCVIVNLGIQISNDLKAHIFVNPVLNTLLQPAQGSTYASNFKKLNPYEKFPQIKNMIDKSQSWYFAKPSSLDYPQFIAENDSFSIGASGLLETEFLDNFGDFLKEKDIDNNCSIIADEIMSSNIPTGNHGIASLNAKAFKIFVAKNLIQSYDGVVRVLSKDKIDITLGPEAGKVGETVELDLNSIDKVGYNPSFSGGCQIFLYLNSNIWDQIPTIFPLRKKMFSKKKYIELYRHKEKVGDACRFLEWLRTTDLLVEQEE